MAVSKNITRESMTLAAAIAGGLADGHSCLLTDQNKEHMHRIGSNYYIPAQSRYYNGASWTYYQGTFASIVIPSAGYFGLGGSKGRLVCTDDAMDYLSVKTADLHIPDGWLKIGADTQPTVALDVVGAAIVDGALTVTGLLTASASIAMSAGGVLTRGLSYALTCNETTGSNTWTTVFTPSALESGTIEITGGIGSDEVNNNGWARYVDVKYIAGAIVYPTGSLAIEGTTLYISQPPALQIQNSGGAIQIKMNPNQAPGGGKHYTIRVNIFVKKLLSPGII